MSIYSHIQGAKCESHLQKLCEVEGGDIVGGDGVRSQMPREEGRRRGLSMTFTAADDIEDGMSKACRMIAHKVVTWPKKFS